MAVQRPTQEDISAIKQISGKGNVDNEEDVHPILHPASAQ